MPRRAASGDELIPTEADEPKTSAPQNYQQAPISTLEKYQGMAERLSEQFDAGDFDGIEDVPAEAVAQADEVAKAVARTERELLRQEAVNQKRQREEYLNATKERRKPRPIMAQVFSAMPDASLTMDEDGKPAGTEGFHKKHARMVDGALRESNGRVSDLAQWGYRPVKSRVTGRPIATQFGLLMEAPPEAEGKRRAAFGRRVVDEQIANEKEVLTAIEQTNREWGGQAMRPFRASQHNAGRE